MNIKNLLLSSNCFDDIYTSYLKQYPLFEVYELEHLKKEDVEMCYKKFYEKLKEFMTSLPKIEIENSTEDIVFITKQKDNNINGKDYINSWSCKKAEIDEKIKNDFVLWNDEKTRIEHYCYDMQKLEKILAMDVYFLDVTKEEAICEILNNIFRWGLNLNEREKNIEALFDSLEESLKQVDKGKTIDAETFFKKLEDEIIENASDEMKEVLINRKQEKEKNKERDALYSNIATRINHKKCILIIEDYYLNFLSKNL